MPTRSQAELLSEFRFALGAAAEIAAQIVGEGATVEGPFGPRPMIYADYVASGRAVMAVERFVLDKVLPYYANSHTEASFCGGYVTRLRSRARQTIAALCGADERHAVIFSGAGATSGLNRLVHLFGVEADTRAGRKPCVVVGPYEHHSNILPWRESGAEVIEVGEASEGGADLGSLREVLTHNAGRPITCAFSACSNVTGIVADVAEITRLANRAGARMIWDYAGGGPYLPIAMHPAEDAAIDAIVISPHKFIGGPQASGILIVRRTSVVTDRPTWPGGGTVRFVSPEAHDYSASLEAREEAGTPNVVGDIRAALAFLVKDAIGDAAISQRNEALARRAIAAWSRVDGLELLGNLEARRLPVFSFRVRARDGGYLHPQFVTRFLSDRYGIQARGGCACAGPYALRLLGIGRSEWRELRDDISAGNEIRKPGFTRLNFSVLLGEEKVDHIIRSVIDLAGSAEAFRPLYREDRGRAIFTPREAAA